LLSRVWSHRDLVLTLTRRGYFLRYRQSLVGFGWAILPLLATLGVATLVFQGIAHLDTGGRSYVLVTMAALVPWTFFANGLTAGVPSVTVNAPTLTRIAFPRAALPLAAVGVSLIDVAIASAMFVIAAVASGQGLPVTALLFPLLVVVEVTLVTGIVLVTSAMNVFARDLKLAVPLVTQLWLFATPVMYPLREVPRSLRPWFLLNPMTGVVESARGLLIAPGRLPEPSVLAPAIVGAVVFLLLGLWYFSGTEDRFADAI
jgi:lipopolysaccharide transport system permease protein